MYEVNLWIITDVLDLRSISKDNVGGNPQDDVWSAVIVNIPENK